VTTHSNIWFCVYDPEEGFSGSRLFGYHFAKTLLDGYFPLGSIWYQQRNKTLFVIRTVSPPPEDESCYRQRIEECPAAMEASLPLAVKRRIVLCRTKPPAKRWHSKNEGGY
jgi:hypothetical protein